MPETARAHDIFYLPLKKNYLPETGWREHSSEDAAQQEKWKQEGYTNFGIDTGKSGLIVVDLDVKSGPNGIKAWEELCAQHGGCPLTYTVKTKSGGQHHYFWGASRNTVGKLGPGIDTRSQGGYVVAIPSAGYSILHNVPIIPVMKWLQDILPLPKSEQYRDDSDKQIVVKDDPRDVEWVIAILNSMEPPVKGTRNDALYKLACKAHDKQVTEETLTELLQDYNDKHSLEQDIPKTVHNVYHYAEGKPGGKSVLEFTAIEQPEAPAEPAKPEKKTRKKKEDDEEVKLDLENDPSPILIAQMNSMNAQWCTVLGLGAFEIMRREKDARGYNHYKAYKQGDFLNYHANDRIEIMTKYGPKFVNIAKKWLEWKMRTNYSKGPIFDPTGQCGPDYLNTWQGWAVQPVPGDWSLLRNHIWENIAMAEGPETANEHFNYIMKWFAYMFQYPAKVPGVALVLRGLKGTGKSVIGEEICKIVGAHGNNGSGGINLTTQYNSYMANCIFSLVNEITWAGDKEGQEILKDRITAETLRVEPKGKDVYHVKNFLHIMITSNAHWVIPATDDERRYAMFNVLPTRRGDDAFWDAVFHQMNSGGREAMLYELLNWPLGDWAPRKGIPRTKALEEQIVSSYSPTQQFLADLIECGEVPQSWIHTSIQNGDWQDHPQIVLRDEISKAFQLKAGLKNEQIAGVKLGKEINKLKVKENFPHFKPQQRINGQHVRFHLLPPLSNPVWDSLRGQ